MSSINRYRNIMCILCIISSGIVDLPFMQIMKVRAETEFLATDKQSVDISRNYYIIGPGDQVFLEIFDYDKLDGIYEVMSDGTISLPSIGRVNISDLSIEQASKVIQEKLSKDMYRTDLYLKVQVARILTLSVLGDVKNPGVYKVSPKSIPNSKIKLTDAIARAGGINPTTNLKEVEIIRRLPGKQANYKKTSLNLIDLIIKGDQTQNPILFDGDTIKFKKAKAISPDVFKHTNSTLASKTIDVAIYGEVESPGKITLPRNTPLVQAIYSVGGPNKFTANINQVEHLKINPDGTVSLKKYKLNIKEGLSNQKNPSLSDGDVIIVRKTALATVSGGVNSITSPITSILGGIAVIEMID